MPTAKETMSAIEADLANIRAQLDRLKIEEATLIRVLRSLNGESDEPARKRIANIKPMVLDVMQLAGEAGATSLEVFNTVRMRHPEVSRDTISSVLSRLKASDALIYDGERYYDSRYVKPKAADLIRSVSKSLNLAN